MSSKRVLVTGGAGFIGSHLTDALLTRGYRVAVYDNLSMGRRSNVPKDAEFIHADMQDRARLEQALRGVDVVYHLAARVSIRDTSDKFIEDAQTNLMGTLNLLAACGAVRPQQLVLASSMAVYADSPTPAPVSESYPARPISGYGIAKLAAERYCLQLCPQWGVSPTVLRFFNTFGPRQTYTPYVGVITIFIKRLLAGEPLRIFGTGEQSRDFVHVSDIVSGCLRAIEAPADADQERIFNIGTGRATSVLEIAAMLNERLAPRSTPEFAPAQPGELHNCVADIDRARRVLAYAPQSTLDDRIDEVIEYLKKESRPS